MFIVLKHLTKHLSPQAIIGDVYLLSVPSRAKHFNGYILILVLL